MTTSPRDSAAFALTAVVPPGLEEVAAAELTALGASEVRPGRLQVSGRCDLATYYRLHLRARLLGATCSHVSCWDRQASTALRRVMS